MIILPSRNGMLLRNSNGIISADCGNPVVCGVFPQYINLTFSNVNITSADYHNYGNSLYAIDNTPSLYNTTFTIPFNNGSSECRYYLTVTRNNISGYNISDCSSNVFSNTATLGVIRFNTLTRTVIIRGQYSPSNNYDFLLFFSKTITLTQSEWDDMIANKQATFSNDSIQSSTGTICGFSVLQYPYIGGSGGSCVVSW